MDSKINLVLNSQFILFINLFCSLHFQIEIEHDPSQDNNHNHKKTCKSNSPEEPRIGRNENERYFRFEIKLIYRVDILYIDNMLNIFPLV